MVFPMDSFVGHNKFQTHCVNITGLFYCNTFGYFNIQSSQIGFLSCYLFYFSSRMFDSLMEGTFSIGKIKGIKQALNQEDYSG